MSVLHLPYRACYCNTSPNHSVMYLQQCLYQNQLHIQSLVQASPIFCSSVCVQYNTWKWKSTKNREGLVSSVMYDIRWMRGGRDNDVRGRSQYSTMYEYTRRAIFLLVKMSSFDHANVFTSRTAVERLNR